MLPESPLIVCCLTDSFRGVFKRGKDTEPKTTIARKKYGILLQRMDCAVASRNMKGFSPAFVFPGYLLPPKYSTAVLRPYPGIPELLAELRNKGVRCAIVSNKPHAATQDLAAEYFKGICAAQWTFCTAEHTCFCRNGAQHLLLHGFLR